MKRCQNCNAQYDDAKIYCPDCGNLLIPVKESTPPTEKKKSKARWVVVSILLAVSLIGNVILGIGWIDSNDHADYYMYRYRTLNADYNDLKDDYNDLKDDYNKIKNEYDFYNEFARVVPNDGSGKYHRYGCSELNTSSFWIYNVGQAKEEASPCSDCCSND